MNTHDIDIELPPLPTNGGIQEAMKRGPDFVGQLMQSYARAAVDAYTKSKEVADGVIRNLKEAK